jgi:alpha-methylacyl-CoA racemase
MSERAGLLAGVNVVDLSSVGPASRASRILSDYGARVIKIQPPQSKRDRQITPPHYAYSAQRNDEFVGIDLKSEEGKEALWALAGWSDVLIESFRPGVMATLGFAHEDLHARCPRLIICATTGYGQRGERSSWAGHDLNYLGVGGYLAMSERNGNGLPGFPGATIADAAAGGMQAALSIMAALVSRERSGKGEVLDVAISDGVLWLTSLLTDEYLATGVAPRPGHDLLSGRFACYGIYKCSDDQFLAVGAIEPKFFSNLCTLLGVPELISRQYEGDAQDELRQSLGAIFHKKGRDEWVELLGDADTCVSPILEIEEIPNDARMRERLVNVHIGEEPPFQQLGPLLAGMAPLDAQITAPDRNHTNTDTVFKSAGVTEEKIKNWRQKGGIS